MMLTKRTAALSDDERQRLRTMLDASYEGDFSDADWEHALGGVHFLVVDADEIVSHASVVERTLIAGEIPLRTGFVEAVATVAGHRRRGCATTLMRAAGEHIRLDYALGSLCTGERAFYERLGGNGGAGRRSSAPASGGCERLTKTTPSWCCALPPRPLSILRRGSAASGELATCGDCARPINLVPTSSSETPRCSWSFPCDRARAPSLPPGRVARALCGESRLS